MVVTDDEALAVRLRRLRSHGMTTLTWDRHRGHAHSYDVVAQGFNYRMDEIHATLGAVQLRRLGAANDARAALWGAYVSLLADCDAVHVPFAQPADGSTSSHHIAPVVLAAGIDRSLLRERLAAQGIQTSVHYPPIHRFTQYAGSGRRPLPETDEIGPRLLTLPLYPHMGERAVELVVDALREELDRQSGNA